MRCAVVIEKASENYSACVQDLPACVAAGETVAAVEAEIRDAIRFPICEEVGAQRRVRARSSKRRFAFPGADDGLLSFFAATFAPVKFELSPERLAETLLR
jgi:hypothetical protein